jgi:hypothetical protein
MDPNSADEARQFQNCKQDRRIEVPSAVMALKPRMGTPGYLAANDARGERGKAGPRQSLLVADSAHIYLDSAGVEYSLLVCVSTEPNSVSPD